jgi:hypothetical protein
VQLQAFGTFLVTVICLAVLGSQVALAAALALTTGGLIWGYFAGRYRLLRERGDHRRSEWRRERDDAMVQCLLGGLVVPAILAWVTAVVVDLRLIDPPLDGAPSTLLTLSLLVFPLAMLVSSSVDWYLIRPFRDGVLGVPVCQESVQRTDAPQVYATLWVAHRMVSEFFVFLAVSGLIIVVAFVAGEATKSEDGEQVLNLIGIMGVLGWTYREQAKLLPALDFVRKPSEAALGAWTKGRNKHAQDIEGFLLDLSVDPGVQLINEPRGCLAKDIADEDCSIPLAHRRGIKAVEKPRTPCPGGRCEFWVAQCDVGLRQAEERERNHDS